MSRISAVPALLALTAIALVAIALALSAGSVAIDPASVLRALFASGDSTQQAIVRELRLPRAVAAFAAGGCLSLAGALLQVLLRNSLADPYVLGVSGGAAAGALTTMLLGAAAWLVPVGAFGGAMASTAIVFGLARGRGPWSPTRLLLTGVVVAAGWGAVVALILSLAPEAQLRGMLFWLIGDLSAPPAAWSTLGALVLAVAAALPFAGDLNALARGDTAAAALGVDVLRLPWLLFALAAFLTAAAVTTAGAIGFVGLIVPHAVRLVLGNDQRVLLPAAALAGGTLLLVADILARQIAAPAQLPTGVITALIGVPTFLYLLRREQR
ncbi:MAG: iron ABC transporter permease [Betaproteobacteria bacterium]|jgi:iron complex transport system permease protein|nr:MAG: iron ABC transporter permease [Betaproteobacteria bacterium]